MSGSSSILDPLARQSEAAAAPSSPPIANPAAGRVSRAFAAGIGNTFRGGIVENCKRFKFIGSGYDAMPKEQNRQFDVATARQCAGPMAALTDPYVRVTHVIGATQVLKSMNGDAWVLYSIEHERLPFLVLFEDDGKADLFCGRRLMDTVRNHPHIARMLDDTKKESRHNVTGTWIKFVGFELLVAGLNEGNVSTLSWPRVWVSEAWQHPHDGLLAKAFKRTDRYPNTFKILNESQASVAGTDLHNAVIKARPVPLVWRCPACDGEQTWEWHHWSFKRPADFVPRAQKKISTVTIGGELALVSAPDPKPGSYAGMKIAEDLESRMTIEERARRSYWECIHCGHRIHDTKVERMQLCETYSQDYQSTVRSPQSAGGSQDGGASVPARRPDPELQPSAISHQPSRELCFTIPFEAAWDNRFEKTVQNFLVAKRAKEFGNDTPMQDWFLSERALFYKRGQTNIQELIISPGSYDPRTGDVDKELIPGEHSRDMAVDCQEDADHKAKTGASITGWFWYVVRVFDKFGNSKQLARGYCKSWMDWIAVQHYWKVPNDRVIIDVVQWSETVIARAVEYRQTIKLDKPHPVFKTLDRTLTWKLLAASPGRTSFKHTRDGIVRPWSPEVPVYGNLIDSSGRARRIPVMRILFNKTPVQLQVDALYSAAPGLPKFEFLSRAHLKLPNGEPDVLTREMETGMRTYENQMSSQYYDKDTNKYVELRPDDHYYWCEQALIVRVGMDGLMGHSAIFSDAPNQ